MVNQTEMKKIVKSIFLLFVVAVSFSSCRDDYEMPDPGAPCNPEKEVAGTYTGTWTRTNAANGEVIEKPGTLTLSSDTAAYVSIVSASAEDLELGLKADYSVANIMKDSSGSYTLVNPTKGNPFGCTFTATVSADKQATMEYSAITRSGRKEIEFMFKFSGAKTE